MKAIYQKPLTEVVEYMNESKFLDQSYNHADARGNNDFIENEDEETFKSQNLWDE